MPTHAAAATRCKTSAARWIMASTPEPPTAWPAQANVPTRPAATLYNDFDPNGPEPACADRNGTNSPARRQAKPNRASQSRPKPVSGAPSKGCLRRRPPPAAVAHGLRDQDEPRGARKHGHRQAYPGDPCEARPHDAGELRAGIGSAKCRLGDENKKESNARDRDRRGEMNCANVNQCIVHALLPSAPA